MVRRGLSLLLVLVASLGLVAAASAAPIESGPDCPEGMECGTVTVPLDWTGKRGGKLDLPVQVADREAPLLLFLAGGPGQGFVNYGAQIQGLFDQLGVDFRIATLDQRGTGSVAIDCEPLQSLVLTDLTVRPRSSIRSCGRHLGARRAFYSTASTVRDLEKIRRTIGVARMSIMGTSYGTYVAMRYARAYPNRVNRLVLDSVVPQQNIDPFMRIHMKRAAWVMRNACGQDMCGSKVDPARHLTRLISKPARKLKVPGKRYRLRVNGPALLDWITTIFSFDQVSIRPMARSFRKAANGNYDSLLGFGAYARKLAGRASAGSLSWGLHAATLCSDTRLGIATSGNLSTVRNTLSRIEVETTPGKAFWPFDRKTALGNGVAQACIDWPITKVAPPPKPGKIKAPTLLLSGQYDISTPVGYAWQELKRIPKGRLVVVPRAGHSVAFRSQCVNVALASFLTGKLKGDPCRAQANTRSRNLGELQGLIPPIP